MHVRHSPFFQVLSKPDIEKQVSFYTCKLAVVYYMTIEIQTNENFKILSNAPLKTAARAMEFLFSIFNKKDY